MAPRVLFDIIVGPGPKNAPDEVCEGLKRASQDCRFGAMPTRNCETSYTFAMSPSPVRHRSLIWGSTFWAITLQLGEVPPAVSVVYRFGISAAGVRLVRATRRPAAPAWRAQGWRCCRGPHLRPVVCLIRLGAVPGIGRAVLFALMVFWTPICNRILFGARSPGAPGLPAWWQLPASACCSAARSARVAGNRRGGQRSFPAWPGTGAGGHHRQFARQRDRHQGARTVVQPVADHGLVDVLGHRAGAGMDRDDRPATGAAWRTALLRRACCTCRFSAR